MEVERDHLEEEGGSLRGGTWDSDGSGVDKTKVDYTLLQSYHNEIYHFCNEYPFIKESYYKNF